MDHELYFALREIQEQLNQMHTEISTIREALFETTETKAEQEYKEVHLAPKMTKEEE